MCSGKCSRVIAGSLYPLVLLSILCNTMLFFRGWDVKYAKEGHVTEEVKYLGGIAGGGILVLVAALYIQVTGEHGCCGNRLGMFFSIIFAAVGAAGGLYSFIVAALGLANGPLCYNSKEWITPFKNSSNYVSLTKSDHQCIEPKNVVMFDTVLFIALMAASCLQVLLCAIQVINGLVGCLCGTCNKKEEASNQ
ncbi:transmembrane 4 L6 family member 1-like isoform X2 [Anabas testudineus]|uniref:Uncharacterized protein n=1 Tax=Anabas testudineus TaxID=64144 RepID=A0A3Q1IMR3_ANATE|nr:transmembrane 4 L6 family member 1-like isoform X2 [Anabas testudineus]